MSVQDLTNTTWVISDSPTITSGYGIFSLTFSGEYANLTGIAVGYNKGSYVGGGDFVPGNSIFFLGDIGGVYYVPGATISITGGNDVSNPNLISWLEENATMQSSQLTVDLTSLSGWDNLAAGTYSLTIKAKAQGYKDSNLSTGVSFTKAPSSYTVTVSGTINSEGHLAFYDGQDTSATLLLALDNLASSYQRTLTIESGYLYVATTTGGLNIGVPSSGITMISYSTLDPGYVYYQVTADGTITDLGSNPCYIEGTLVTLADGTKKPIEDITYDDSLLVWNFYKGKFDIAKPEWIMQEKKTDRYNLVTFDNGTELGLIGPGGNIGYHRIFNKEAGAFTHTGVPETPNGTTTFCQDGTFPKIVSQEIIEKPVKYYNVITSKHYNIFTNGILTSSKISNQYKIDENMKYDLSAELMSLEEVKAYLDRLESIKK